MTQRKYIRTNEVPTAFQTVDQALSYLKTKPRMRVGQKEVDKTVLDLAYERIYHSYELFDTIAVSFSGGKDSTACLNLTLEVARILKKLPLEVVFYDEEAIPYQTEQYVRRVAQIPDIRLRWYCIPVKHRNACSRTSPYWSPWDLACPELWVRPLPPESITYLEGFPMGGTPEDRLSIPNANGLLFPPKQYGTVGMMMGIRAHESMIRRQAVLNRKEENYIIPYEGNNSKTRKGNLWKIYPIYDWRDDDVWTAPTKFSWDYNEAYDVMTQAGIGIHSQRCSPAFGEEPMQSFDRFKTCFPEIWPKMTLRVPGANAAVRYAKTELWGYLEPIQKPEEMSWKDYIMQCIQRFPEEERDQVADRIRLLIEMHYRKTFDPLVGYAKHPMTGMSWEFIASIALRGDFKGRKFHSQSTKVAVTEEKYTRMWEKYCEEREKEGL